MKANIPVKILQDWHLHNHENRLSGRYITAQKISPLLSNLPEFCKLNLLGYSAQKRPIHSVEMGTGKRRVLMWSQMHGNESTTTKSVFDLILAINDQTVTSLENILYELTICIVPIVNPDGAAVYTRNNANDIDLNRDAQRQSQPESRILKELFDDFKPDVCFNLHGQRTIYGFEATGKASVLSFLSPSADKERSVTLSRKRSMSIITAIHNSLHTLLPGQIGRYDDGFNLNCVGDTFQNLKVPTVLFEAGHVPNDYSREQCRQYVFLSLVSALQAVVSETVHSINQYVDIPEHQKCYCDVIIRNTSNGNIGIQYQERLEDGIIKFIPLIADNKETKSTYGHRVIDAKGAQTTITFSSKQSKLTDILKISLDNGTTITL